MTAEDYKQALYNNPNSEDAWGVFGKYLSSAEDIRGELISLEQSGGSERINDIYAKNKAQWLGSKLHKAMQTPEPKSFMEKVSRLFSKAPRLPLKLEWQYGFLKEIHLKQGWDKTSLSSSETLKLALSSPAVEFVQYFSIDFMPGFDQGIAEIIDVFKEHNLKAMKRIHLGNFQYPDENELSWVSVGNVSEVFQLFPSLTDLHLTGSDIQLGTVKHHKLKRFKLETGGLPAEAINSLMSAELPELEDLEIWFGDSEYGAEGNNTMLTPLYSENLFPLLKRLGLKNSEFSDEIIKSLVKSDLLKQINTLDLSLGTMTDEGAKILIDHSESFKQLDFIDLNENFISDKICRSLKELYGGKIDVEDQDIEEDGYLYVSVSE